MQDIQRIGEILPNSLVPAAFDGVSVVFGELQARWPELPQSLWDGLYHVATVHGFCERSLRDTLEPSQAAEIDACLHAAMLTTPLWNDINQSFSLNTGYIFQHLCGCGCHLTLGSVQQDARAVGDRRAISAAFFDHRQRQLEAYADQFPS